MEKTATLDSRKTNELEINERSESPIVKVEIKSEVESTPISLQQATGSNSLPMHATKHPVCISLKKIKAIIYCCRFDYRMKHILFFLPIVIGIIFCDYMPYSVKG